MVDVNTGSYGTLRLTLSEDLLNPAANTSRVNWSFRLIERVSAPASWSGTATAANVKRGGTTLWSGSFTYDWRPAGLQSQTLDTGSVVVAHNPDGTGSVTLTGNIGDTNTTGAGGPTSVSASITLTKLTQIPGVPTSVVATRVDDSQISLAWAQANPSNGQPTTTIIEESVNGGAWSQIQVIGGATSTVIATVANKKARYRVTSSNTAGSTAAVESNDVWTTPGAPTDAVAVKSGADITTTFTENVDYSEYEHEVWHGTVVGGVTTWDGAALALLPSGTLSYTHVAPSAVQVHKYRVRAKGAGLFSAYTESNSVQLLTAPAKPTVPAVAPFANKAAAFRFAWVHNAIDSTAQTKVQTRYSLDGGATWTTSAKTANVNQYLDYAANTWTANQAVTFAVRTKGAYDSGADGDASYSPWSDPITVTFKSAPVATIVAPANGGTVTQAALSATLGFAQAEAATYVKAQLELLTSPGGVLLESKESTQQAGIQLATAGQNGSSYTLRARVQDSNGIWSAWVTSTFSVAYLAPVPAVPTLSFIPANGFAQLDLTFAAPGAGQAAATTVTIYRDINGVRETVVADYPVSSPLTILDTTPIIRGTNTYTFVTKSALGAVTTVTANLVTDEQRRAYLSKGAGYATVGVFGANLKITDDVEVAGATVEAAGRLKPIGLYGIETNVSAKVSSSVIPNFGSTLPQLRDLLLVPGKACYRDSSGRRIFGVAKGSVSYAKVDRGDLTFTLTETS